MAVLFLLAVVAGAVALSAGTAMGRVKAQDTAGRIAGFDALTRTIAREQDRPLQMIVELDRGTLRLTDAEGKDLPVSPVELPEGFWFSKLLLRGREMERGTAAISCSREGFSPSYAIRISGPGREERWLLVCGLTGSVIREQPLDGKQEQDIREALWATAPRDDAR